MHSTKRWLAPCLAGLVAFLWAGVANAAQTTYPADPQSRSFDAGPGGYAATTTSEGLCVPAVLCPAVSNSHRMRGGVGGGGHLRTRLGSLTGVGATSTGSWTSPGFRYDGVGGDRAEEIELRVAVRSDVKALLSVAGNSATYSIDLIELSSGAAVAVAERRSLAGRDRFAKQSFGVDPSLLRIGERYAIRIVSRFESGAQVLPGGSADYDDVSLVARRKGAATTGGSGTGSPGSSGYDTKGTVTGSVQRRGDTLRVKVRCGKRPRSRCKVRIDARLSRKGPRVTNARTVRVAAGKRRKVSLLVRPRYAERVAARSRIGIRSRSLGQTRYRVRPIR